MKTYSQFSQWFELFGWSTSSALSLFATIAWLMRADIDSRHQWLTLNVNTNTMTITMRHKSRDVYNTTICARNKSQQLNTVTKVIEYF